MTNQQRSWVQEFRLQSTDTGPWKWTVGTFWSLARTLSVEQLQDQHIIPFFQYLFDPASTGTPLFSPDAYFGPYYSCNGQGTPQPAAAPVPNCDIYYNYNKTYDRQLAGYGEVTYQLTDQWALTAGGRYAKMDVTLNHYSNGYENFGPSPASGSTTEHAFTPKASVAFQLNDKNLFYATYAKGFRPGGFNPPLPDYCHDGLVATGYPSGTAPLDYKSDTTQSFEIGSKNAIGDKLRLATSVYYIKWDGIQQNVYIAGTTTSACGLQFTDNLGTAVAKGFDLQAEAVIGGGLSVEASVGYTDARFTKTSGGTAATGFRAVNGDAISGQAAVNYSPGTNPPWDIALGPQYNFRVMDHEAFARIDWTYASRNPWLAPVQDPRSSQYNANSYTLPATSFGSFRVGFKTGGWQVSAFCENLLNSYTTLSYAQVQVDSANPSFNKFAPSSVQQNNFTYRPRTFGLTATFKM
jgi:outer membrane receptor protein involved in Fe transport